MAGNGLLPTQPRVRARDSLAALALGLGALMLVVACMRAPTSSVASPASPRGGAAGTARAGDQLPVPAGSHQGAEEAALSLRKEASLEPVAAGARLTYTIRVTNTGGTELSVMITDTLPLSVTLAEPADGTLALPGRWWGLTWTARIPAPGVWTRTFAVTVAPGCEGPLVNVVHLTSDAGPATVTTETSTTVLLPRAHLPLILRWARPLTTITGEYVYVGNPCITEPCMPGLIYAIRARDTIYYLTLEGRWLWSNRSWDGYAPEIGDLVSVTGVVSERVDTSGDPFYEIEVLSLEPVPTPPSVRPGIVISDVVAGSDGDRDPGEYVEICSDEDEPVPLAGWTLRSAARQRTFTFPDHVMQPGQCCRVYTEEEHPAWCGFSFGSDVDIWSYAQDCATLRDERGRLVDAACHCQAHSATMMLSATSTSPGLGEVLTATATLFNHGCTSVGVPKYTLRIASAAPEPILTPSDPRSVIHYLGLGPGQSDAAAFALQAARPGQAVLQANASFEVHVGYPGPAYWGASTTRRLTITVKP